MYRDKAEIEKIKIGHPDIRAVAMDLDGTALDINRRFSDRTKEAFSKAVKKGTVLIIATGRAFHSLPKDVFETEGIEYVIMSNGAKILDMKTGENVYSRCLPVDGVRQVLNVIRDEDLNVEGFVEGRAYIGRREYEKIMSGEILTRPLEYVQESRTPLDDIIGFLEENIDNIENISINYESDERKNQVAAILSKIENITVTSSFPLNNEIGAINTSKAEALKFVLEEKKLKKEQLATFGDSMNDSAMIRFAGLGIAMGNGSEEVKQMADFVAFPNYEDGVARAIEEFVL